MPPLFSCLAAAVALTTMELYLFADLQVSSLLVRYKSERDHQVADGFVLGAIPSHVEASLDSLIQSQTTGIQAALEVLMDSSRFE